MYSIKKLDKSAFFYASDAPGGFSKIEFIETDTKLLLGSSRDGDEPMSITHQPYRQDFVVNIQSASMLFTCSYSILLISFDQKFLNKFTERFEKG